MSKRKGWHKGRGAKPKTLPITNGLAPPPTRIMMPGQSVMVLPSMSGAMAGVQQSSAIPYPWKKLNPGDPPAKEDILAAVDDVFQRDARAEMSFAIMSGLLGQALGYDVDRFTILVATEPRQNATQVKINWRREP